MPDFGNAGNWNASYGGLPGGAVEASMPGGFEVVNTISGGALLWIAIILFGAIALVLLLSSIDRYTKFFAALQWLYSSLRYTAFGAGISAVLYGLYIVCGLLAVVGKGIDPMIFAWIIGLYIGFTVLGYIGTFVVNRARSMHKLYIGTTQEITEVPK